MSATKMCLVGGPCKHGNWCSDVYCQELCRFVKEIEQLDALAELCDEAKGGWDLPPAAVSRLGALARKARAAIAAQQAQAEATILDGVSGCTAHDQERINQAAALLRAQQPQARPDFDDEWTGYLKDGETPFERFLRERKDLSALTKLYQRALEENEQLKAQQAQPTESLESLLSTAIGILMGYSESSRRNYYKQNSAIDNFVGECVERLKDWPSTADSPKQAQAEAVPADESKWAAYVAGVIGCYLKEPDDSAKVKAITGIIERRMWASAHQPLKIAAWRGVHVEGDYLYYDEFPEDLTAEQRRQLHLKPLYEGAAPQQAQAEAVPRTSSHAAADAPTQLKPCRSPYCECTPGQCTHPGCYDARHESFPPNV